jgi:hypothetical protein
MIEPEPSHPFAQLRWGIEVTQDLPSGGLLGEVCDPLLIGLAGRSFQVGIGNLVERFAFGDNIANQFRHGPLRNGQRVHLLFCQGRQFVLLDRRVQLLFEPTFRPNRLHRR